MIDKYSFLINNKHKYFIQPINQEVLVINLALFIAKFRFLTL